MNESVVETMNVAVIGGGAAGFFAAIHVKLNHPNCSVTIFEKSRKLLAKVRISGGGRCNVTNGSSSIKELTSAYPRGGKFMKEALREFNTVDTQSWFKSRGVALKTERDNRVFPISDNSQTIIDCLMSEVKRLGITIKTNTRIEKIIRRSSSLQICTKEESFENDKVIVASGGSPKLSGFEWLADLGHTIIEPLPSLFTFNMPTEEITKLMGVVANNASVTIQGAKLKSSGPLLITHWGMSGPAILRLSSFGARLLGKRDYNFNLQVNWISIQSNERVLEILKGLTLKHPKKHLRNLKPFELPERLWLFILTKCALDHDKLWQDIGKKSLNKLVSVLTNDIYSVRGKTTFKEEFVTCGGVSLKDIDRHTMESKVCPSLYFAGEVLDIDGVTGGYNFQAAWTTAFLAGKIL